jgi:hypothetical protein
VGLFVHILALMFALVVAAPPIAHPQTPGPHEIFGVIRTIEPNAIVIARHNGQLVTVDVTYARAAGRTGALYVRRGVGVYGFFDRPGHYRANAITNANGLLHGVWPADR